MSTNTVLKKTQTKHRIHTAPHPVCPPHGPMERNTVGTYSCQVAACPAHGGRDDFGRSVWTWLPLEGTPSCTCQDCGTKLEASKDSQDGNWQYPTHDCNGEPAESTPVSGLMFV